MMRASVSDRRGGARQRGMTLIELLVAMTISVVIGGMILLSWFALSGSYASTVKRGKAGDWARFATARMQREIRDAEQPPTGNAEVAIVRARPFYIVLYTTFNKSGNTSSSSPPRLVMYRLYTNGELWRFQDKSSPPGTDAPTAISGVNITLEDNFPLDERTTGEGAQLVAKDLVNATTPSAGAPTPLFTYTSYAGDGSVLRDTTVYYAANRINIRAVEINMLVDLNPGKSPVHTHLRTTAQLRNAR